MASTQVVVVTVTHIHLIYFVLKCWWFVCVPPRAIKICIKINQSNNEIIISHMTPIEHRVCSINIEYSSHTHTHTYTWTQNKIKKQILSVCYNSLMVPSVAVF